MIICISIVQGLIEILGIGVFLFGYFADIWWIAILGGVLMVVDDIYQIFVGILNPLFPVVLAIVLGLIIDPWYLGIFWSLALFKFLDIPGALVKIFAPHKAADRVLRQMERSGS